MAPVYICPPVLAAFCSPWPRIDFGFEGGALFFFGIVCLFGLECVKIFLEPQCLSCWSIYRGEVKGVLLGFTNFFVCALKHVLMLIKK